MGRVTDTPNDPLIGKTISQYHIVSWIGGGGMGVVYLARDNRLGRTVALKFLPPQWSHDEGARERFIREAQAASATNHRNICVVHDIGQADDGQLFIVMAYYEGQTLKRKLEDGALQVADAVEIATEIADGLAKAHSQGVVHRDVKPGNLMLTEDGVKILDFGLAKFADALQLTIQGSTVGTVAYMSPEQARGEEAGPASDVWALGVVLYEMVTGSSRSRERIRKRFCTRSRMSQCRSSARRLAIRFLPHSKSSRSTRWRRTSATVTSPRVRWLATCASSRVGRFPSIF